jgi:putative hemolysin
MQGQIEHSRKARFAVTVTQDAAAIQAAQQLRYEVFAKELHADIGQTGLDCDMFDEVCDHLLVRDLHADRIVGTYRLLRPEQAARVGYYSATEFDISGLKPILPYAVEAGRACVHADYRGGAVVLMLWSAIVRYLREHRLEYLIGCVSVSTQDDGHNASALTDYLLRHHGASYRVAPIQPFPASSVAPALRPELPPLLKGYIKLGAQVCGAPAYDAAFETADFMTLVSLSNMSDKYLQHFLGKQQTDALRADDLLRRRAS